MQLPSFHKADLTDVNPPRVHIYEGGKWKVGTPLTSLTIINNHHFSFKLWSSSHFLSSYRKRNSKNFFLPNYFFSEKEWILWAMICLSISLQGLQLIVCMTFFIFKELTRGILWFVEMLKFLGILVMMSLRSSLIWAWLMKNLISWTGYGIMATICSSSLGVHNSFCMPSQTLVWSTLC